MRVNNCLAVTLLFLSTLLCYAQTGQQGLGRISGIVLNEDGQPVTNASICVSRSKESMTECSVQTNETGQFEIEHLSMGTFNIHAEKYDDGYSGGGAVKVVLSTQEPSANITLKVGTKAGMLIGTVRDSLTSKPVHTIETHYFCKMASGGGGGSEGKFQINLPTNSDCIIVVTAPGYRGWVYTDPTDQSPELHLASGEQKLLDIELVPKPTAVGHAPHP